MHSIKKYFILLVILLSHFSALSQYDPGMYDSWDDLNGVGANGGLEGTTGDTTPGAPLDTNIIYLLIAATLYGLYVFRRKDKYDSK